LESDVLEVRDYLTKNGIKTYVKNMSTYRNMMRGSGNPSLHVVQIEDKKRALQLLQLRTNEPGS
jgi:hypothetical protein